MRIPSAAFTTAHPKPHSRVASRATPLHMCKDIAASIAAAAAAAAATVLTVGKLSLPVAANHLTGSLSDSPRCVSNTCHLPSGLFRSSGSPPACVSFAWHASSPHTNPEPCAHIIVCIMYNMAQGVLCIIQTVQLCPCTSPHLPPQGNHERDWPGSGDRYKAAYDSGVLLVTTQHGAWLGICPKASGHQLMHAHLLLIVCE
jgi:hypothetical protein